MGHAVEFRICLVQRLLVVVVAEPRFDIHVAQGGDRSGKRIAGEQAIAHLGEGRHAIVGCHFTEPVNHLRVLELPAPQRAGEAAQPLVVEPRIPVALVVDVTVVDRLADHGGNVLAWVIGVADLLPAAAVVAGRIPVDPVVNVQLGTRVAGKHARPDLDGIVVARPAGYVRFLDGMSRPDDGRLLDDHGVTTALICPRVHGAGPVVAGAVFESSVTRRSCGLRTIGCGGLGSGPAVSRPWAEVGHPLYRPGDRNLAGRTHRPEFYLRQLRGCRLASLTPRPRQLQHAQRWSLDRLLLATLHLAGNAAAGNAEGSSRRCRHSTRHHDGQHRGQHGNRSKQRAGAAGARGGLDDRPVRPGPAWRRWAWGHNRDPFCRAWKGQARHNHGASSPSSDTSRYSSFFAERSVVPSPSREPRVTGPPCYSPPNHSWPLASMGMHRLTAPPECATSSTMLAPYCSSISTPGWTFAGSCPAASNSAW